MAIVQRDPNTIYLAGGDGPGGQLGYTLENRYKAKVAITPGMLIELVNDGGVKKWQPHATADDTNLQVAIALEQTEMGLGVNDAYAINDLVKAAIAHRGSVWWAIVPSGQNLAPRANLQSNGDGKFKATGTGKTVAKTFESTGGATAADKRLRIEVI